MTRYYKLAVRQPINPDAIAKVLDALKASTDPLGSTIKELKAQTGLNHEVVSSRLNMLENQGKVKITYQCTPGNPKYYSLVEK